MAMLDIFRQDAFGLTSLTQSILRLPYKPSRIGEMGLFQDKGINTLTAMIEEKNGLLALLPSARRGSMSVAANRSMRKARSFTIPYIPYDDDILASDVQNVRAFGTESELLTVAGLVNDRLAEMRQAHEVTLEWLRMGALHGQIIDGDGSSIQYNLFQEFGLGNISTTSGFVNGTQLPGGFTAGYNSGSTYTGYTDYGSTNAFEFGAGQQYLDIVGRSYYGSSNSTYLGGANTLSVMGGDGTAYPTSLGNNPGQHIYSFVFSDPTLPMRQLCVAIQRDIEKTLGMATYDHIHCFCGANFFDRLIDHDDVRATYLNWFQAANLRQDMRKGFEYGGITFEQYRGSVSGQQFVNANTAIFFPVGVPNLFCTFYAPADFIETVNTIGLPIYAKQEPLPFNKGIRIHTQSNPLPMCTRPLCLVAGVVV